MEQEHDYCPSIQGDCCVGKDNECPHLGGRAAMQMEAQRYTLLAQNRELVAGLQEIVQTVGPSCCPGDWPKLHNVALIARNLLAKLGKS